MANVHPVKAVPNRSGFIHANGFREHEPLAQLGRVDGLGKEVMPLASLVKRECPPPTSRRVVLGQQELDDGTQVVGAEALCGYLSG